MSHIFKMTVAATIMLATWTAAPAEPPTVVWSADKESQWGKPENWLVQGADTQRVPGVEDVALIGGDQGAVNARGFLDEFYSLELGGKPTNRTAVLRMHGGVLKSRRSFILGRRGPARLEHRGGIILSERNLALGVKYAAHYQMHRLTRLNVRDIAVGGRADSRFTQIGGALSCRHVRIRGYDNENVRHVYDIRAGQLVPGTIDVGDRRERHRPGLLRIVGPEPVIQPARYTQAREGTLELVIESGGVAKINCRKKTTSQLAGELTVTLAGGVAMLNKPACVAVESESFEGDFDDKPNPALWRCRVVEDVNDGFWDRYRIALRDEAQRGTLEIASNAVAAFAPTGSGFVLMQGLDPARPVRVRLDLKVDGEPVSERLVQTLARRGYEPRAIEDQTYELELMVPARADRAWFVWDNATWPRPVAVQGLAIGQPRSP